MQSFTSKQIMAWLVHLYTVAGGIVAMFAMFEFAGGNFKDGFLLVIVSRLIDGTDGLLARKIRIWEVTPNFSGEMVDNLIDIFTYLWLPLYIVWKTELLPSDLWLIPPVLGTMYAYGQKNMKTEDNFFLGFPSLWGSVAIYVYFLQPVGWVAVLMLLIPSIFSFIPLKYLYPSKNRFLSKPSWVLSISWIILWLFVLIPADTDMTLVWISLYYPAFYLLGSFYASYLFRDSKQAVAAA